MMDERAEKLFVYALLQARVEERGRYIARDTDDRVANRVVRMILVEALAIIRAIDAESERLEAEWRARDGR